MAFAVVFFGSVFAVGISAIVGMEFAIRSDRPPPPGPPSTLEEAIQRFSIEMGLT